MKFIGFFLAILVLSLSCLPCADSAASTNYGKMKVEISHSTDQTHDDGHADECSPFCHCACCATYSVQHTPAILYLPFGYHIKTVAAYLPANTLDISLPVWQPPQLS